MILTQVETDRSEMSSEGARLASGERSSCLRSGASMAVICVGDTELADHSEEEWYPPTPPLYDVTDKLR